jgi:perosamine synthetase
LNRLAIRGGKPCIPKRLRPWLRHDKSMVLSKADLRAAMKTLREYPYGGPNPIPGFEQNWARYVGARYCVAMNSGTAALQTAMKCIGLERGDEVITSAFTFLASASCVLYQNGVPVFADIDPRTYNLSPKDVERRITRKTRAIIPVHIAGLPADMEEINRLARKHGLAVVEDACQAHGALYKGKPAGALGDIGCFSLEQSKNLTGAYHGGMLTTSNDDYAYVAGAMRQFGEVIKPNEKRQYNARMLGHMFRIDPVRAAIANSRLPRLEAANRIRRRQCERLSRLIRGIPGVTPPYAPPDRTHVYYFYVLRFDPVAAGYPDIPRAVFRAQVAKALEAEGVHIGQWQTMPVPRQDVIAARVGYGKGCPWTCRHAGRVQYDSATYPETNRFFEEYTCLWCFYLHDKPELADAIADAIHKVFMNLDALFNGRAS